MICTTRSYGVSRSALMLSERSLPLSLLRALPPDFRSRVARRSKLNDLRRHLDPVLDDQVHDLDAGALDVVHERVHPRRKIAEGHGARDRHDEPGRGGEQTLINAVPDVRGAGEAALG